MSRRRNRLIREWVRSKTSGALASEESMDASWAWSLAWRRGWWSRTSRRCPGPLGSRSPPRGTDSAATRPRPALHGDAGERLLDEPHVMRVRSADGESDRDAWTLGEQTSLGAGFASIRRIGARFSPPPAVPSSSPHPSTASATGRPSARRILRERAPRAARTRHLRRTAESSGATNWTNRTAEARRSIESRSAAHRRSPRPPVSAAA
jgi:hypothetical protein